MSAGAIFLAVCAAVYAFIVRLIYKDDKLQRELAAAKVQAEKEKIHAETKSMSNDELIDSINHELGRNDQK